MNRNSRCDKVQWALWLAEVHLWPHAEGSRGSAAIFWRRLTLQRSKVTEVTATPPTSDQATHAGFCRIELIQEQLQNRKPSVWEKLQVNVRHDDTFRFDINTLKNGGLWGTNAFFSRTGTSAWVTFSPVALIVGPTLNVTTTYYELIPKMNLCINL